MSAKYIHPLAIRFMARCMLQIEGLNWLQERGWISDLVVELREVAPVDVARIAKAFDACWVKPRLPAPPKVMRQEALFEMEATTPVEAVIWD